MKLPYRGLYRIRASTHLRALCANIATAHLQDVVCVCVCVCVRAHVCVHVCICACVCERERGSGHLRALCTKQQITQRYCVRVGMCVCVCVCSKILYLCVYIWYACVYIYTTHHLLELRPIKLAGLGEVLARNSQTSVPQYI
jgi:hypothetical protein